MEIKLIYAKGTNGVIGNDGKLPWHLPEDLARFKILTAGSHVIMGRKTWESLPERFRPLPGRKNIVITKQTDFIAEGAYCANSFEQAIELCKDQATVWVIGGEQIYSLAMPFATGIEVTEIDCDYSGDSFAPVLDSSWVANNHENHQTKQGLRFNFVSYIKRTS